MHHAISINDIDQCLIVSLGVYSHWRVKRIAEYFSFYTYYAECHAMIANNQMEQAHP